MRPIVNLDLFFVLQANKSERGKSSPTYKDLDFMEQHPNGIFLEADTYNALVKTIQRDCRVLESFKIMDYSLLVGVHNLDTAIKEKQIEKQKQQEEQNKPPPDLRTISQDDESDLEDAPEADQFLAHERHQEERERHGAAAAAAIALNRSKSINRQRLVAHSTAMESIQADSEPIDVQDDVPYVPFSNFRVPISRWPNEIIHCIYLSTDLAEFQPAVRKANDFYYSSV